MMPHEGTSGSITLDHLSVVTNTPKQITYDQQRCIQQIPQDRFHFMFHVSLFIISHSGLPATSDLIHLFQLLLLSSSQPCPLGIRVKEIFNLSREIPVKISNV